MYERLNYYLSLLATLLTLRPKCAEKSKNRFPTADLTTPIPPPLQQLSNKSLNKILEKSHMVPQMTAAWTRMVSQNE